MTEKSPLRSVKRILALDGGGICALFTLQVLAKIEEIFRLESGNPRLVLRDEFDFFAGTSTGAIVAAALAWGMTVGEIERLYVDHGSEIFARAPWTSRLKARYGADTLARLFRERFCEDDEAHTPALLGTRRLWAGDTLKYLLIIMRNATTGSAWPVSNNPRAMYNDQALPDCNLRIPLWQLLRASTAAPTYFAPEAITLGDRTDLFVDGGITPYNNPALIAVLTATLPCYRLEWPTGADRLLLVSIGTGSERVRLKKTEAARVNLLDQATYVPPALLDSIAMEQDMVCRVLGDCRHGDDLDSELRGLAGPGLFGDAEKRFAYVRYNRLFTAGETSDLFKRTKQAFTLDNIGLIPFLQDEGRKYAERAVRRDHFVA